MNEHLKAASERFKIKTSLINPISISDANIISELIIATDRLGIYDIKRILEQWKYLKDESIEELLLQFNIDNPKTEENDNKRKFIEFENEIIEVSLIKTIGINQDYNFLIKKMEYKIIINKDLEEKYMLTNGVFKFLDFDLRNKKLKELKDKLKDFIKII